MVEACLYQLRIPLDLYTGLRLVIPYRSRGRPHLDEAPRLVDAVMIQGAVRTVFPYPAVLIGEDLVRTRALLIHERAIAEEAVEILSLYALVTWEEFAFAIRKPLEIPIGHIRPTLPTDIPPTNPIQPLSFRHPSSPSPTTAIRSRD